MHAKRLKQFLVIIVTVAEGTVEIDAQVKRAR